MEISLTTTAIAALAGMCGTLIGGMETFIMYGAVVIVQCIMTACGADTTAYTTWLVNLFFLPACIFNGTVGATGYAAKKYDIGAWQIERSLAFTHDPLVLLVGAVTAVFGYVLCALITNTGFGVDAGSVSVVVTGILCRLCFPGQQRINKDAFRALNDGKKWIYDICVAAVCAASAALLVEMTGFMSIGFAISAFLLLFQLSDKSVPSTHHITMTAGYAIVLSGGNLLVAILAGIVAQVIFTLFGAFYNMGCGSHIDPPAVAIGLCSLLLYMIF